MSSAQTMGSLWSRENPQAAPPQESQAHPPLFFPPRDEYHRYKLIVVGDHNTGKTSLMSRFTADNFIGSYSRTFDIDFVNHRIQLDEIKIELQVWYSLTSAYYKGSVCAIITYSATDEESFNNVPYWMEEVKKYAHRPDTILALVGTKCDCIEDKAVDYCRARDFAREKQIPFFEVSNKDGTNVELAFMTLVAGIRQLEIDYFESSASNYKK